MLIVLDTVALEFHSSVEAPVGFPPKANAAVLVPAPANPSLPTFKSPVSVQLLPFQVSVNPPVEPLPGPPPNAKADALLVPAPASFTLPVFKSFTSVQLVPFQDSVTAVVGGLSPPNAKADVCVPPPAKKSLAVFKSFTSVQLVPFHNSVFAKTLGS